MMPTPITVSDKMLESVVHALSEDVAQRIVNLGVDESLQSHVEVLAGKANEGELTDEERFEYEAIVSTGDFVATLQTLARRRLQQTQN